AEEDRRVAVAGMRFTRRIMSAPSMAKYEPEEYRPGASVDSDAGLEKAAGELGTTIFHPVGTCKMGRDAMAVVDDELRVHGVGRLRVIDASIMPRITSGNTNSPTYVIAERGARLILGAGASGEARPGRPASTLCRPAPSKGRPPLLAWRAP